MICNITTVLQLLEMHNVKYGLFSTNYQIISNSAIEFKNIQKNGL